METSENNTSVNERNIQIKSFWLGFIQTGILAGLYIFLFTVVIPLFGKYVSTNTVLKLIVVVVCLSALGVVRRTTQMKSNLSNNGKIWKLGESLFFIPFVTILPSIFIIANLWWNIYIIPMMVSLIIGIMIAIYDLPKIYRFLVKGIVDDAPSSPPSPAQPPENSPK